MLVHMHLLRPVLLLAAYCLLQTALAPRALASGEFSTAFTSTYTVGQATTHVTHQVDIANNLAHIYTTSYTLSVGSDRVTGITAHDETGSLPTGVDQNGAATTITISIMKPAMGKDQVKHLLVAYDTPDIAEVIGSTASINIPRLYRGNEASSYTRIVVVPRTYPPLTISSPEPSSTVPQGAAVAYTFMGHPEESVSLLFGSAVTYRLTLNYDLTNPTYNSGDTELALPPDTPYQTITVGSISPEPSEIRVDKDGNWLALYHLASRESRHVQATVYATVRPSPAGYDPSAPGSSLLTAPAKYWETTSASVHTLASSLATPENIYNYLVDNFQYNYHRVGVGADRLGAAAALTRPTDAICTEFTDTFVGLARSLGTPAREENGFAYSTNSALHPSETGTDILHAWPEYYDAKNGVWTSVDPTWGNTTGGVDYFHKLDFSHITFVRHGQEPNYPYPAGAYKQSEGERQVVVEVSSAPAPIQSTSRLSDGTIMNTGNVAINNSAFGYLPPYGRFTPPPSASSGWDFPSIWARVRDFFRKLVR